MRSISDFVCRSNRGLALVAVLVLLGMAAGSVAAPRPNPTLLQRRAQRWRRLGAPVARIHFAGNRTFDRSDLLAYMELRESGFFGVSHYTAGRMETDIATLQRFYETQGFLDARVLVEDLLYSDDGLSVEILIGIYEGDRWSVSDVSFDGNSAVTEGELRALLTLAPGGPFLWNYLEADRRAILDEYAGRSYLDARVGQEVVRNDDERSVSVSYSVVERSRATIKNIRVIGAAKTRDYVIEREMKFSPGEFFDPDRIGETQAGLYSTGLFNSVWIEPAAADTGRPSKTLDVRLSERPSGLFGFGIGYAAIDRFRVSSSVSNANVQGQAIRLTAGGRVSETVRSAELSLGDPWFLGVPVAVDVRSKYEWSEDPYRTEQEEGSFVLSKQLRKGISVELGYEFARNLVFEAPDTEEEELGANYTSDVLAAVTYDTRDDVFDATSGAFARAEFMLASKSLGGTNDFTRTDVFLRGFSEVKSGKVAALSVRLGWLHSQADGAGVPLSERYFAGGEGSVRGFERSSLGPLDESGDPLGGRALVELRAEARFPLYKRLRAVAFVDAGQVYQDFSSARLDDAAIGAGFGLRYATRVGVFRLDVAYPASESGPAQFYFSIGQAF